MSLREQRDQIWKQLDEIHALVNLLGLEKERLRAAGAPAGIEIDMERERLIEQADQLFAAMEQLLPDSHEAPAFPSTGRVGAQAI